jgi:glycosyltransferase involved in cell wall biosynthesis
VSDPLQPSPIPNIAVLSAGRDKPYALGLSSALLESGIPFEFLGSDEVDAPSLHDNPLVTFRNLRGDQSENATLPRKAIRVIRYYGRLVKYAVAGRPRVFHILWNNKFEYFDRTILMLFYKLCGRKLVFTAHNVNTASRDDNDSLMNRLTLRIQYGLSDHIFVHTERMRQALKTEFAVDLSKITVIPFGMNSTVPDTALDRSAARKKLSLSSGEKVLLFFGNIAPYKGLEHLINSMDYLPKDGEPYRLLVAGRLKCSSEYWQGIEQAIARLNLDSRILLRIEYIPDEETEVYFKAADVLVLPYTYIFQSGVLFLGYNFGLPVLAADVGSLKEDIVEGKTGFIFRPGDPADLGRTIVKFFESDLGVVGPSRQQEIRAFAAARYSWSRVASLTVPVYEHLLGKSADGTI